MNAFRTPIETCLFDLDGTLVDSIELIFRSYEHAYAAHGRRVPARTELVRGLGRTLMDQFGQVTADAQDIAALVARYRAFNLAHHDALVSAYPGALPAVEALRRAGVRLGIVTSKVSSTAHRGLALCGYENLFEVVIGMEDCTRHKPHPEPVLTALERLGADPRTTCYVGDSPHDMQAGRAAGVRVFAAGWGPFAPLDFADIHVDRWLARPLDVVDACGSQSAPEARRLARRGPEP